MVSVPLRGVGCFDMNLKPEELIEGFRPLAGCGLFLQERAFVFGGVRCLGGVWGRVLFWRDEL